MVRIPPHAEYWKNLVRCARKAGWIRGSSSSSKGDLEVGVEGRSYLVELRVLRRKPEKALLLPLFADAHLRAQARARDRNGSPLPIVAVSRLSPGLLAAMQAYVAEFAPGSAWGILDAGGQSFFDAPGLPQRWPGWSRIQSESASKSPASRPRNPYSDLGQWLVKVLLAPRVPERFLRAPRSRFHKIGELAAAAEVSLPSVSKILSALEARNLAERSEEGIRAHRPRALLEDWRRSVSKQEVEVPCQLLSGVESIEDCLRDHASNAAAADVADLRVEGSRVCLAQFSASRSLGLGFVRGAPHHLYAENVAGEVLEALGLYPSPPSGPVDVYVRKPRWPESVFRGRVAVDGIPASDALQCWLDVSFHPARGAEQAERVLERLGLEPRDPEA